jgi:glycogen synthase
MTRPVRHRIALVSSSYAPYIGGVEHHTAAVAAELRKRGHAVEVWTVDRGEGMGTVVKEGLTVRHLPTPLPAASPSAILGFLRTAPLAWQAWRSAHRMFRPDVLHVQCFGPNGVYAELLGSVTGTPRVVSSHGETQSDDHNVFEHSRLLRAALRRAIRAGTVTGCSAAVSDDLRERFGAVEVVVVPNGVDLDVVPELASVARDQRRVVGVGRLEYNKGFDLLLEAATHLPADVTIELVGSGSQESALLEQATECGLAERVTITGKVSHAEVLRRMSTAGVVCVPSRKESFGIVVLEAWAVGTPVVATSLCGPVEFAQNGRDAFLVDPLDTKEFAQALRAALHPPTAAPLVQEGQRSVKDFTWGRTTDLYEKLYADLVNGCC